MMVFVLFAVHQGLVMFSPILSSKKLADAVEQEFRPGDVIVSYGTYEDASTLNFYVRQPIHVVNTRTEGDMFYGSLFPDAPAIFEDDASLARLWKGPRRDFLVGGGGQDPGLHQAEWQLSTGPQRRQIDPDEPHLGGQAAVKKTRIQRRLRRLFCAIRHRKCSEEDGQ